MTGSNSISVMVDNILGAIRIGELGSGTADLYTAAGELKVGVPRGTATMPGSPPRLPPPPGTGRP